jgi:hypothetical protein
MKLELEQELFNIAPEWFRNKGDLRASLMAFGFECGDGWFELLKSGMEWIKRHTEDTWAFPDGYPHDFQVVQVKEKFGTLRFYTYGDDDYTASIIRAMEMASHFICEGCGASSKIREDGGWLRNMCEDCYEVFLARKGWRERNPEGQVQEEEQEQTARTESEG